MPELPEVETIRQTLEPALANQRVDRVVVRNGAVLKVSPRQLRSSMVGARIRGLDRRGKYLIFRFSDFSVVFHLGMTGQLTLRDPSKSDASGFFRHEATGLQQSRQHPPDRHTHLRVFLEDGLVLQFRDVRKFGKVFLVPQGERGLAEFFSKLGLEPFSGQFRLPAFLEKLTGRRAFVKAVLLDQSVVAGVGNIYADEALFVAGIHPARRIHHVRMWEKEALFGAIELVLEKGIRFGGTTFRDYIDSDGKRGRHQEELFVYGRQGQACRRCGSELQKIVVGQRGTHFCPMCQPRSGRKRSDHFEWKGSRIPERGKERN